MITAKIIAHSIDYTYNGKEIITYELEYPRFIHSEFMTHRVFSRNAASSRAIPVSASIQNILSNPAKPVHWGKNQPGMVADDALDYEEATLATDLWYRAAVSSCEFAKEMADLGVHKQIVNRITEPFSYIKVIMTSTEWANFFWLRDDKDAQPEIRELAQRMLECKNYSTPFLLLSGEWHLPYVKTIRDSNSVIRYLDNEGYYLSLEDALKVSASCCAQVSYRKNDDSLEKAEKVFNMLNLYDDSGETRKHASPVEHQATPIPFEENPFFRLWPEGVTHQDRDGNFWSGNFNGWIQHRQLIPNESKK